MRSIGCVAVLWAGLAGCAGENSSRDGVVAGSPAVDPSSAPGVGLDRDAGIDGAWILTLDKGGVSPSEPTLTMLRLPVPAIADGERTDIGFRQAEISSGLGTAESKLSVSPDGSRAAVRAGAPNETSLLLVALDRDVPAVIDELAFDTPPASVAWSPSGEIIAVALPESAETALVPVTPIGFQRPSGQPMPIAPIGAAWHPDGTRLVVLGDENRPATFYEVSGDPGNGFALRELGYLPGAEPETNLRPRSGFWTPDGSTFVVFGAIRDGYARGVTPAGVSLVRFDPRTGPAWRGGYSVAGLPLACAMSPTGDAVAVVTVQTGADVGGAVTLLSIDPATGVMELSDRVSTDGAPSAAVFDATGRHLLTADFDRDAIRCWWIDRTGEKPQLRNTGLELGTGVQPHAIAVVP